MTTTPSVALHAKPTMFVRVFGIFAVGETMYAPVLTPLTARLAPPGMVGATLSIFAALQTAPCAAGLMLAGVALSGGHGALLVATHVGISAVAAALRLRTLFAGSQNHRGGRGSAGARGAGVLASAPHLGVPAGHLRQSLRFGTALNAHVQRARERPRSAPDQGQGPPRTASRACSRSIAYGPMRVSTHVAPAAAQGNGSSPTGRSTTSSAGASPRRRAAARSACTLATSPGAGIEMTNAPSWRAARRSGAMFG